jgi:threonine synthase
LRIRWTTHVCTIASGQTVSIASGFDSAHDHVSAIKSAAAHLGTAGPSSWHRWAILAMLTHAFLAVTAATTRADTPVHHPGSSR